MAVYLTLKMKKGRTERPVDISRKQLQINNNNEILSIKLHSFTAFKEDESGDVVKAECFLFTRKKQRAKLGIAVKKTHTHTHTHTQGIICRLCF